jgi:hypothetical protein
MGQAKKDAEEHEVRLSAIAAIALKQGAIVMDPDTDEISSNLDEEADKQTFATVFQAWAEGRISGTADEVFEAINEILES